MIPTLLLFLQLRRIDADFHRHSLADVSMRLPGEEYSFHYSWNPALVCQST